MCTQGGQAQATTSDADGGYKGQETVMRSLINSLQEELRIKGCARCWAPDLTAARQSGRNTESHLVVPCAGAAVHGSRETGSWPTR